MIRRSALAGDTVAVLQRAALQDPRLSYRAVGILVAVLSRPLDWRTSAEQLARERPGAEGRDAIRTALRELETAGYLVRTRVRDDLGRIRTGWDLSDTPLREASQSAGHTDDGKPAAGRPAVGRLGLLQGVETGSRDKPSLPPPVVSPDEAEEAGGREQTIEIQGGDEASSQASPAHDDLLDTVIDGVGRQDLAAPLRASGALRAAVRCLGRAGVSPVMLRRACGAREWAGAGVGAVVRYVQGLRPGDLVVRAAVGPPECPEHPGQPAGRCRECERASAPRAAVAGLAEGLRAAVRTSRTVNI